MPNTRYDKYIVTDLKPNIAEAKWTNPVQTAGKGRGGRVLFLDSEVVPGAFYVETAWSFPRKATQRARSVAEAHKHDYDEVLGMFGTDINDPYRLNGEVEFWLEDEKFLLTRSCIIFIPRGTQHCPLIYHRIDKPIFNFTTHNGKMYVEKGTPVSKGAVPGKIYPALTQKTFSQEEAGEVAGSKYGKYIVTQLKQNVVEAAWTPPIRTAGKGHGGRILFLDSEVVPGAFYVETVWVNPQPGDPPGPPTESHKHDFDEVLCFFGTNPDDPKDLCGEIELWLGDERHILTKSCIVFVPQGLMHCPLKVLRAERPIFEFTTGPGTMYG